MTMAMPQRPVGWYETITTEQVIKLLCLMAMAMPQLPVGLDMKLSQPNVRPVPQKIICIFRLIAISEQFFVNIHILF